MRETNMIDMAWSKPDPQAVVDAGYEGVVGYISHDSAKDLSGPKAKEYVQAGLKVAFVFETTATEAEHGASRGAADCQFAETAAETRGYPANLPIFYAVDEDLDPTKAVDYFRGIHSTKSRPSGPYGSKRICDFLAADNEADIEWQTAAWSGGELSQRASLYQRISKERPKIAGVAHNAYDENVVLKPIELWGGALAPPSFKPVDNPKHGQRSVDGPKKAKGFGPLTQSIIRSLTTRLNNCAAPLNPRDTTAVQALQAASTKALDLQ
jgi:hypothetical protein